MALMDKENALERQRRSPHKHKISTPLPLKPGKQRFCATPEGVVDIPFVNDSELATIRKIAPLKDITNIQQPSSALRNKVSGVEDFSSSPKAIGELVDLPPIEYCSNSCSPPELDEDSPISIPAPTALSPTALAVFLIEEEFQLAAESEPLQRSISDLSSLSGEESL